MRAVWLVLGGALSGCATPGAIDTPEAALDASDVVEAEGNLLMAIIHGSEQPTVPEEQIVADVATTVALRWEPAGCASASRAGADLTITFDDCAGPRGLVHVTGTLNVSLVGVIDGVAMFYARSPRVSVNGATLTVSAHVWSLDAQDGHRFDGLMDGPAVGPRGNEVERWGWYWITWPATSECTTLVGEWDTDMVASESTQFTTSSDVTRCPGACPLGSVKRRFMNDADVTVTLDGTTRAHWESTAGRTGVLDLDCE